MTMVIGPWPSSWLLHICLSAAVRWEDPMCSALPDSLLCCPAGWQPQAVGWTLALACQGCLIRR